MITPAEALTRLEHAAIRRTNFGVGSGEYPPLAHRSSVRKYRDRLLEDIEHERWRELDDAFYTVSSSAPAAGAARCTPSAPMFSTSGRWPRAPVDWPTM